MENEQRSNKQKGSEKGTVQNNWVANSFCIRVEDSSSVDKK